MKKSGRERWLSRLDIACRAQHGERKDMEKGVVFMKQFMNCTGTLSILVVVALLVTLALVGPAAAATKPPASGTTLAAVKTIDTCDAGNGAWRYSGDIALW